MIEKRNFKTLKQFNVIKNTAYCYLDKHYKKHDGSYNVKLCVNINHKRHYIRTEIDIKAEDWERLNNPSLKDNQLKTIRLAVKAIEAKATGILQRMVNPTYESFLDEYTHELYPQEKDPPISKWFEKYYETLLKNNRPASYTDHILTSKNSFDSFASGTRFSDVTKEYIEQYSAWMMAKPRAYSTIQSYLRDLRTVYNFAISKNAIGNNNIPFGKDVTIGSATGRKKAISKGEIQALIQIELPLGSMEDLARDLFIFQYLVNGINILDLCKFKQKNIDATGKYLTFMRTKTTRTKREHELITAYLQPDALRIIRKWGNKDRVPDSYIFPFFNQISNKKHDPKLERKYSQELLRKINLRLKKLSLKLGFTTILTSGVARSTYATVLRNENVPTGMIGEGMGHGTVTTTENYFKSLDDERIREISNKLL